MSKKISATGKIDILVACTLYPLGDLIGQMISHNINFHRLIALALIGCVIYRREVPDWFARLNKMQIAEAQLKRFPWLNYCVDSSMPSGRLNGFGRTMGSVIYFNPFWIARHMLFIKLATTCWAELVPLTIICSTVVLGIKSFLINLPLSYLGNYVIQAKLPLHLRYLGSVVLSTVLAIMYALLYSYLR